MKDKITTFDLNAAFKALDDIEMPKSEGLKPQKAVLDEALSILPKTDCLLEDYYDVRSGADLRAAEEERRNEVAQAKLDRIEKIIDLDAKTPEDLQGSYAGKIIIQCPQCMELFYKKEEDLVVDEDDPTLVNVGEKCQHCGNTSGYMVIGKVGEVNVAEDEAKEQAAEEPAENAEEPELSDASILGVDPVAAEAEAENDEAAAQSEEAPEEISEEQPEEQAEEPVEGSEEPAEESEEPAEEEKKEESLNLSKETSEDESEHKSENLTLNEEVEDTKVEVEANNIEKQLTETSVRAMRDTWTIEESSILKYYPNKHQVEDYINKAKAVELAEAAKGNTVRVIIYEKFNRIPNDGPYSQKMGHPVKICYDSIENPEVVKIFVQNNLMLEEGLDEAKSISGRVNYNAEGEDFAEGYILKVERNSIDYRPRFTYSINTYKKEIERLNNYFKSHFDRSRGKTLTAIENENLTDKKKEESLNNSEVLKGAEKDEMHSDNLSKNLTLNEEAGKDLDKQLKLHNEYIDYLQKAIKQEEDALKEVENEEIKAAIQRRLDGFKEDLQAALPEAVKDNLPAEDTKLPEPGEIDVDADSVKADEGDKEDSPVEESLNKSEFLKKAEKDEMHTDLEPENKSLNESGLAEASEVSDSEIEELFNSDEFKTPISDSEVERIIAADKNESFKLEDLEDVDDQMLEKCITESLTSVYENVAGFKLGDCSMSDGKLIVEGKINFKSGKSKNTKYIFEQADRARKTILLNGLNESLGKDSSFKLTAKLTEGYKKLAPTKLSYEYKINGDVVTGEAK